MTHGQYCLPLIAADKVQDSVQSQNPGGMTPSAVFRCQHQRHNPTLHNPSEMRYFAIICNPKGRIANCDISLRVALDWYCEFRSVAVPSLLRNLRP